MGKKLLSLPLKINLLLFSLFIYSQGIYSQCVSADPVQEYCAIENKTVGDLQVTSGINVVWYNSLTGGNQYDSSTPLINGNSYYGLDIDSSCTDLTRFEVSVLIYGEPPTNVDVFVGKCASENPLISDLSADGTAIKWFSEQSGGTQLASTTSLENGKTYWVQQTENGCTSDRLPTTVNLVNPTTPTVESIQYFCSPPNATVADLKAVESNIVWYSSETSTSPLNTSTLLVDGEDYWATQLSFPCESTIRIKTTVVLDTAPNAGTDATYSDCELNLITTNLFTLLGGSPDDTGVWTGPSTLSGDHLGTFDPATNTEGIYTYTVSSNLGICPDETASVEVIILKVEPATTSNTTQVFCDIDTPTVGNLSATGIGIQWYPTQTSTTALSLTDLLIDGEDYWATQTETTGCESTTRLNVIASIITPLPPTTTESTQTFCDIDNPTIANLSVTGTSILWYGSETSTTPLDITDALIDGENYWATQTEATGCESASRLMITATIIVPLPPTTTEVDQTFCEIDNPTVASLSVTGTGIVWYDTEISTTALEVTEALIDGEDYWATQTETTGCESIIRLQINATIQTPLPPTTTESTQTFCEIDNPTIANLTASGTDITWYESETSTTALNSTDTLIDGEDYWATQTDAIGCESDSRLIITVSIIKPLPPTTTEAIQTFCEIDNPTVANLSASGTGILWYDTETSTTALDLTEAVIDGEDYWATQTDATGCESASRLVVNVTVLAPLPPTTSESDQTFCEIDAATIADLNVSGTEIIWYESETSTTALELTDAIIDGEDYWATQTDAIGCESATRLVVNATILVELPPTTSETTQTFCEIDNSTVSDLAAVGSNIRWYDTETSTTPLNNTDALVNGEDYWATQSAGSSCESDSRLVVTVSITAPLPPTTSAADQTFCMNDFAPNSPTIANITVTGTSILWYLTETSTTPLNTTDILIDGQTYWATQTEVSGCESTTRLSINVSIINPPKASTTETNQTFCAANNSTIAELSVTGDTILWFETETSTTPLNTTETLVDGEDYWALNTDATTGCESSERLQITATITQVLPPVITNPIQSFCEESKATIANLEPSNTLWFASETGTTPLDLTEILVNNSVYWASAVNSTGCISAVKVAVTVELNDPGTPILETNGNEFCKIDNPILADLDDRVSPENNGTILWYNTYPNGNPLSLSDDLDANETYYAIETDSNGCSSAVPLEITIDLEVCDEYDVTIYDGFSPNGDGINDTFKIENLRVLYPDFKIQFFNRWGNLIYTADANREDWNGRLKGDGEFVTSGVYYFIINFNKNNRKPLQDRLYLSR